MIETEVVGLHVYEKKAGKKLEPGMSSPDLSLGIGMNKGFPSSVQVYYQGNMMGHISKADEKAIYCHIKAGGRASIAIPLDAKRSGKSGGRGKVVEAKVSLFTTTTEEANNTTKKEDETKEADAKEKTKDKQAVKRKADEAESKATQEKISKLKEVAADKVSDSIPSKPANEEDAKKVESSA